MSGEDIARLLGGYATGTLTPEEQQALFAAALEDQALFDELTREQALRDVLREPAARAQLLAALEDRLPGHRRFGNWMLRPAVLTALAVCLLLAVSVAIWRPWRGHEAAKSPLVATALPQEAPPIPSPPPTVGQKTAEVSATEAVKKAKTPAVSRVAPPFMPRAAPAAKAELPFAQSAAPAPPAGAPVAPSPAPKTASASPFTDLSIKGRDAAELIKIKAGTAAPGVSQPGSAPAGNAFAGGALFANGPQPASAPAKKELPAVQTTAPVAAAGEVDAPVAPFGAAAAPAARQAPQAPQVVNREMKKNAAVAPLSTSETVEVTPSARAPVAAGQAGGVTAGNVAARGALSINVMVQTSPVVVASGGDARERYYASATAGTVKAAAQTQDQLKARTPEKQPAAQLGIKWSVLRREANGGFVIVNAEDLRAGDTVELRLTANQACDLSVLDNANGQLTPLFEKRVDAGETVDTPPLTPREKGLRELMVRLARGSGPMFAVVAGAHPEPSPAGQQSQTERNEHATYTVGPPGAQQVYLSISLNYR